MIHYGSIVRLNMYSSQLKLTYNMRNPGAHMFDLRAMKLALRIHIFCSKQNSLAAKTMLKKLHL